MDVSLINRTTFRKIAVAAAEYKARAHHPGFCVFGGGIGLKKPHSKIVLKLPRNQSIPISDVTFGGSFHKGIGNYRLDFPTS